MGVCYGSSLVVGLDPASIATELTRFVGCSHGKRRAGSNPKGGPRTDRTAKMIPAAYAARELSPVRHEPRPETLNSQPFSTPHTATNCNTHAWPMSARCSLVCQQRRPQERLPEVPPADEIEHSLENRRDISSSPYRSTPAASTDTFPFPPQEISVYLFGIP